MAGESIVAEYIDVAFFWGEQVIGDVQLLVAIDLDRPFRRDELDRAAAATEAALPILGCRYEPRWWRDRWVPDASLPSPAQEEREVATDLEAATADVLRERMDARRHRPWRIWPLRAGDRSRLVISISHRATDAAGALAVVREFGAHLTGADPHPGWGEQEMERGLGRVFRSLRLRDLPVLAWETLLYWRLPYQLLRLARPRERWVCSLDAPGAPLYRTVELALGSGSPLRQRCRQLGCTVNDALVAMLAMLNGSLFGPGHVGNFFTINFRPYLQDPLPRVANLSGIDSVILERSAVGDFTATATAVLQRTARLKQRFTGLPAILSNHGPMLLLPHGMLHTAIRLWLKWAFALLDRGLIVTNIGPLDPYLDTFGDRATAASLVGPFLPGILVPIITATSFRDRLTLQVNGFEGPPSHQLALVADGLEELMVEWRESSP